VNTLPANERYTYVFDGNSQALDHIFVTNNIFQHALDNTDIIHLNAEFASANRPSDHDPVLARFSFDKPQYQVYLPWSTR
jgi:predicted extracellular nuclease